MPALPAEFLISRRRGANPGFGPRRPSSLHGLEAVLGPGAGRDPRDPQKPLRGLVLYEGPSPLGGVVARETSGRMGRILRGDVALVATLHSTNRKTGRKGGVVQTWILARDMHPRDALLTGVDQVICGFCPHRPSGVGFRAKRDEALYGPGLSVTGRSCYVDARPLGAIYRTYRAGGYRPVPPQALEQVWGVLGAAGYFLRIGSYGDPAAVPVWIWEAAQRALPIEPTCYTHQWALPVAAGLRPFCMASVDSESQGVAARAAGWRTFRVGMRCGPGEVLCPASDEFAQERGFKVTCEACRLCCGGRRGAKSIFIPPHGPGWKTAADRLTNPCPCGGRCGCPRGNPDEERRRRARAARQGDALDEERERADRDRVTGFRDRVTAPGFGLERGGDGFYLIGPEGYSYGWFMHPEFANRFSWLHHDRVAQRPERDFREERRRRRRNGPIPPAPPPRGVRKICAWCGRHLSGHALSRELSHGICGPCREKMRKNPGLDEERRRAERASRAAPDDPMVLARFYREAARSGDRLGVTLARIRADQRGAETRRMAAQAATRRATRRAAELLHLASIYDAVSTAARDFEAKDSGPDDMARRWDWMHGDPARHQAVSEQVAAERRQGVRRAPGSKAGHFSREPAEVRKAFGSGLWHVVSGRGDWGLTGFLTPGQAIERARALQAIAADGTEVPR